MSEPSQCDVLILTAREEELDALRTVLASESLGVVSAEDPNGFPIFRARIKDEQAKEFTVIAARPHSIGSTAASNIATRLITEFRPRCVAMCGYCAGKPENVSLGDVIVAEKLFPFDQGKQAVEYGDAGNVVADIHQQSTTTFNLDARWKIRFCIISKAISMTSATFVSRLLLSWENRPCR